MATHGSIPSNLDIPSGSTLRYNGTSFEAVTHGVPNDSSVTVAKLSATGTPSSSTYLRGDGTWATPAGGGGGLATISDGNTAFTDITDLSIQGGSNVTVSGTESPTGTLALTVATDAVPPGGSDNQLQYKSGSLLAGAANVEIDTDNLKLVNVSSEPSAPTGGIIPYSKNIAGRSLPKFVGPAGMDSPLQPALFGNNVVMWLPGTGTTLAVNFGTSFTARNITGAQSHPAPASTNMYTSMRRAEFAAGAVAGQASGIQGSVAQFWRGNAAGLGGFYFFARIGSPASGAAAGSRFFVGLSSRNATTAVDFAGVPNTVGLCADSGDTNWQLLCVDGSTVASKYDTGLAKTTTAVVLDFYMFCKPNDSKVTFRLVRRDTDVVVVDNVERTSNLPASTTFMYPWLNASSSTANASTLGMNRLYVESDI